MAAALSRCKTGFPANGLEWGASGVGGGVSVNPRGSPATVSLFHGSYPLYPASNCA